MARARGAAYRARSCCREDIDSSNSSLNDLKSYLRTTLSILQCHTNNWCSHKRVHHSLFRHQLYACSSANLVQLQRLHVCVQSPRVRATITNVSTRAPVLAATGAPRAASARTPVSRHYALRSCAACRAVVRSTEPIRAACSRVGGGSARFAFAHAARSGFSAAASLPRATASCVGLSPWVDHEQDVLDQQRPPHT